MIALIQPYTFYFQFFFHVSVLTTPCLVSVLCSSRNEFVFAFFASGSVWKLRQSPMRLSRLEKGGGGKWDQRDTHKIEKSCLLSSLQFLSNSADFTNWRWRRSYSLLWVIWKKNKISPPLVFLPPASCLWRYMPSNSFHFAGAFVQFLNTFNKIDNNQYKQKTNEHTCEVFHKAYRQLLLIVG